MERRQTMNVGKVRHKFDTLLQYYKKRRKKCNIIFEMKTFL